eukprot:scaffold252150_cov21-Tisochrysis_lutea.AAC.1
MPAAPCLAGPAPHHTQPGCRVLGGRACYVWRHERFWLGRFDPGGTAECAGQAGMQGEQG